MAGFGRLLTFHRTLKAEEVYWHLYADPRDARQKLEISGGRYNRARPHWALRPADLASVLTPYDVYVIGHQVNPPKRSRWDGWLEKDQEESAQPSCRIDLKVSA